MSESLSPVDRARLASLFERAAQLPQSEHAAFLERECGFDDALRNELGRVLAGLAAADVMSHIQPGPPTRAGMRIGPYKLLEKIGEGGMGEVYAAEQQEPVVRRVALKIIKPGMDSAQVIARFEAERQALARMSHPNIAQVFDGGTTEGGGPYFVMEYVAGEPINEHCDRRKLSTRARLELFLDVCEGVQHAHQKGIIHRDLKPSNLLVIQHEGRAVPKIIDFGVARAITGRLAQRTLHTMLGQIVGTLDYMSPEQADPTAVDIDTRSDIYSLGVVLYQLLSGLLPFEHRLSVDAPLSEVQRTIRHTDPPTPSSRLRRKSGTAAAVASLHGTDERSLLRQLSGDLDWICMKALEKDPARRYASASEFAQDVRRHLAHQPVLAGRPGRLYRARKFVRRNRVAVGAGSLVAAGLTAGIVGVVSGRLEAIAGERLATAQEPQVDFIRARQLVARADALWPAHPAQIGPMLAWIDEAKALVAPEDDQRGLAGYRARLIRQRGGALPWTDEQRDRDRSTGRAADELSIARADLAAVKASIRPGLPGTFLEQSERRVQDLESRIAALASEVTARRTWTFESELDQSTHDVLAALVEELEVLGEPSTGLMVEDGGSLEHGWSVPKRIAFAERLEEGFGAGGEHRQQWEDKLPSIRQRYPGLILEPQMGLVPLGPDPQSGLWEFAHLMTGDLPVRDADGNWLITGETAVVLVLLPPGRFTMGAQGSDPNGANYYELAFDEKEGPPVSVDVPAFFFSKYEMTQGQWTRFVGANPNAREVLPAGPVSMVTWTQCERTLSRLGLRLPHEEQWEYAARARTGEGVVTPWSTGETAASLQGFANLLDQSVPERMRRVIVARGGGPAVDWNDGFPGAAPVGSSAIAANPFGVRDLYGNVTEWCSNSPYKYVDGGRGPMTGPVVRMARGGNWATGPESARPAFRLFDADPDSALPFSGLRPARDIDP